MTKHFGGEKVTGGIYWSKKAGEFVTVPADGGELGGGERDQYIRTPLPLVLILGPLMGAAFAMFLPLSGMLVLAPFLATKLRSIAAPSAARMATPQPQVGVSYLEAAPRTERAEGEAEKRDGEKLIKLAEAIAEKRMMER